MSTTTKSNKIFNAALFTEHTTGHSFSNLLTGDAPKQVEGRKSSQTSESAPIVRITDLSKTAGDEVEVDIVHELRGRPTMGDRKLEGRGETLTTSSMNMKIDQGRHMVDAGGKMAQKRTKHDLLAMARTLLGDRYFHNLEDELTLYHLAGARGTRITENTIVPLASDSEFNEIVVNSLKAPTFDRHSYAGNATALDNIDSADLFTLDAVERIRLDIDESTSMRIRPIKYKDDKLADESPLYVLYVTPRQLFDMKQAATQKDLNMIMANAMSRSKGFNHPIFQGECYMWENILIKKMPGHFVEFAAGSQVSVSQNRNDAATTIVVPGVNVHRAILLGGQALANAFGNVATGDASGYFGMTTEEKDHGNTREVSLNWMNGKAKIQMKSKDGRLNDLGVHVIDSAVSV